MGREMIACFWFLRPVPPTDWAGLVQARDDCDAIHMAPEWLPDIDIHSL
jgi:hypothetical protein